MASSATRSRAAARHPTSTVSWSAGPPASERPREFRITAGFTEDVVKFGSEAHALVKTESVPTREEAVDLMWPAVWSETGRALGGGEWRPAIRWVVVAELLSGWP